MFLLLQFCETAVSYHIMAGDIEKVLEVLVSGAQKRPDGACAFINVTSVSLFRVIAQERAVETRVCVLNQLHLQTQKTLTIKTHLHVTYTISHTN